MRLLIALSLILGLFILGCLIAWFRVKPVEQSSDDIEDGDACWSQWEIDEGREG